MGVMRPAPHPEPARHDAGATRAAITRALEAMQDDRAWTLFSMRDELAERAADLARLVALGGLSRERDLRRVADLLDAAVERFNASRAA